MSAPPAAGSPGSRAATRLRAFTESYGRWLSLPVGALLALAFAPAGAWPLAFLCPAFLMLCWEGVAPREAAWRGLLFTAGTFLAGTYWLYHSIHLIGHAPVWVTLVLMLGMVAIMGGYTALLGYAAARWGRDGGPLRFLALLPAGWVLTEWVRGWFLSGFPWLALGYSQLDTPLAAYAPVGGVYLVSLGVAVTAGALVLLVTGSRRARTAAVVALLLAWGCALALGRVAWTQPRGTEVTVALVQGAVPQSMKWAPGQLESTMNLYLELTIPHLGVGIIVWPESAIPSLESGIRDYLDQVTALAASRGSSLITGLVRRDAQSGAYYNAMAAWSPHEQWYYKRRLVPFGEFFPVPAAVRDWMRLMNLPYSDFAAGTETQRPLVAGGEALAPTICYEDAYGVEQLPLARESTLLVNVTNDAWFGDSSAPHQHLDISRMRSLETGRPMLRATNDGVTALIAYDGRVIDSLSQFQPGVLTGTVEPRTGFTPYLRAGNWPVLALLAIGLIAGFRRARHARVVPG
ncbi:MAG: apolipoprotein N-acyltransferase [Steroidobacteraceae bacterium]|nr:apolipoprotein N-acyltransferase [Steroidobacteraceae bacterium]